MLYAACAAGVQVISGRISSRRGRLRGVHDLTSV